MTEIVKCFDAVTIVTDEATERFAGKLFEDQQKNSLLQTRCSIIDDVAKEFDGIYYDVSVDEKTTDITISLVCGCFVVEDPFHDFYEISKFAKYMVFSAPDEDTVRVSFIFDGIWSINL